MNRHRTWILSLFAVINLLAMGGNSFPDIRQTPQQGYFPLADAVVCTDLGDYRVVQIAADMLADDIQRVTGRRPNTQTAFALTSLSEAIGVSPGGKWDDFFNWQPYHWFRSEKIEQPVCTPQLLAQANGGPRPRFLDVDEVLAGGAQVPQRPATA